MSLPTGVQYRKAVQNPKINFRDADLARSTAECGANGMPLTYSGGFATTFRMVDDGAEWAVRCFISPVAQLEKRYKIIGRYISQDPPAFLVNAALLANGIQVDAHWHSVIKMEWLGGPTLNAYIETQLQAASKIIKLRDELMELAAAMQARDMAHGDLQHGNIIVSNGRPRLVDYDGIYLPELSGMVPNESGHKHYQHPQRAQQDWGPHMDRFSQIVLHVGLTAIAQRRDLWQSLTMLRMFCLREVTLQIRRLQNCLASCAALVRWKRCRKTSGRFVPVRRGVCLHCRILLRVLARGMASLATAPRR